jgi:hypothetical protein
MLLARTTRVVQKDGIHHDGDVYFADELWGMVGEEVEVAHMPHDRRWIEDLPPRPLAGDRVPVHGA